MKTILGLDIGTNSIGWALVNQDFDQKTGSIIGTGARIIPMTKDVLDKFGSGQSISQTAERTAYRSIRKQYQRKQQRRERLHRILHLLGFLPAHYEDAIDFEKRPGQFKPETEPKMAYRPAFNHHQQKHQHEFVFMDAFHEMIADLKDHQPDLFYQKKNGKETSVPHDWTVYYLRKKALHQPLTKAELAWVLLHFNQKRGYHQLRGDEEEMEDNKSQTFEVLTVSQVVATDEYTKKQEPLHEVHFTNGWTYDKPIIKTENWEGRTKEFIVTSTTTKDGGIKRTFKEVDSEKDWVAIKKKTQEVIDKSEKYPGTFIYDSLLQQPDQKVRGKLIRTIDRKYYREELRAILTEQCKHHPELQDRALYEQCIRHLYPKNQAHLENLLPKDFTYLLSDDLLFYQRPLKTKKGTITDCAHEKKAKKEGNETVYFPLKAAPKSHPLFQEFRLWQLVETLRIIQKEHRTAGTLEIDADVTEAFFETARDKEELFTYLRSRKEVSEKDLLNYLQAIGKIQKAEKSNYKWNKLDKAYPAGKTHAQFISRLAKLDGVDADGFLTVERELHLWHIVYSVKDPGQYRKALGTYADRYGLPKASFTEAFAKFPPFEGSYGQYSTKALKKLLPLMRMGRYWNAADIDPHTFMRIEKLLSGEHDEGISDRTREKASHLQRIEDFQGLEKWRAEYVVYDRFSEAGDAVMWESCDEITNYLKNEFRQHQLRNPIVEQVITETLRVVHDIWQQYGDGKKGFFSEIHLELAREMKKSADKRKEDTRKIAANENTNKRIRELLKEMAGNGARHQSPSHREKLKIYEEGVYQAAIHSSGSEMKEVEKIRNNNSPTKDEMHRYRCWLEQGYTSPYTGRVIPLSDLFGSKYEIEHIIPRARYFDDSLSNKVICETEVNRAKEHSLAHEFIRNNSGDGDLELLSLKEYQEHCKTYFAANKTKLKKLLADEVPDGFINRQINDTRHISRFLKGLLSNIVREEGEKEVTSKNVVVIPGAITNQLKNDWGLNDKWNELIAPRFQRMNELTGTQAYFYPNKDNVMVPDVPEEQRAKFNKKRIDHRHHALDALIIACTTRNHVTYLSTLESQYQRAAQNEFAPKLRHTEKKQINGQVRRVPTSYKKPWSDFTIAAKKALEETVISFKQNLRVINKVAANKTWQWVEEDGVRKKKRVAKKQGDGWAIRKSMHKATVQGKVTITRLKKKPVSLAKALEQPDMIVDRVIKRIVKKVVQEYDGDIRQVKKHFKERPILRGEEAVTHVAVRETIEAYASRTVLSKEFTRKQLDSVTDSGIRKILDNHVKNYTEGDQEQFDNAFSPEGIEALNQNIQTLNEGKHHKPIYHVRTYEESTQKFAIGQEGAKAKKYVEAEKGTNLFFAIYWDEEKKKRDYETVPLHEVIAHQKLVADLPKTRRTPVPVNANKGHFLFSLSPNDLVYVPTDEELESPGIVDVSQMTADQKARIYKMVSATSNQCYFVKHTVAAAIVDKVEFQKLNKMERDLEGTMIKTRCWKLQVDRLGNVLQCMR